MIDNPEIFEAELNGLRRMTLDDAELRETRERRTLLRQSIADERSHIAALDKRKDWVSQFDTINTLLMKCQQEAQNAGRQWAALGSERNDVALYQRLMPLRPLYERICTQQDLLARMRNIYNECEQTLQTTRAARDAARSASDVVRQRRIDADEAYRHRVPDINTGYHVEGAVKSLESQLHQAESVLRQSQLVLNSKEKTLREQRQLEAEALKNMEEANTQQKGLGAHSVMLGLYDLVKDKLAAMGKERAANDKLHSQQEAAQRDYLLLQQNIRQRENELALMERERDQYRSQLLLLNQSSDTALDIVRAPIIRDPEETQRQIDKFLSLRTNIRNLEEQLHVTEMEVQAKRTQLDALNTEAAVAESHRLSLEQAMRDSDMEVGSLYADLDNIITLSGWFSEWQRNPDALRARIRELYHNWQNARTRYQELTRSTALLHETLAAAEQGVAESRQQELQQRNERDALRRQLEEYKERLRSMFGESTPAEQEKALLADLNQANERYSEQERTLADAQKAYNKCKSQQNTILNLQERLQESLRRDSAELDLWLENNNVVGQSLLQRSVVEEIFSRKCNWAELQHSIDEADQRRSAAAIRLDEVQRDLATLQRLAAMDHPGSDDTPAIILQRRHESEQRLERFESELLEVEGRLFAHDAALRRIENLQRQKYR